MELEKIKQLIDAVSHSELKEFQYEEGDMKIALTRQAGEVPQTTCIQYTQQMQAQQTQEGVAVELSVKEEPVMGGTEVVSPLVGTFYAAPAEDAPAFVKEGDHVSKGQVLAIVEAMKLMNEIEAETDGIISEVLAQNGQMVEYGQPLFRIQEERA